MISTSKTTSIHNNLKILRPKVTKILQICLKKFCESRPRILLKSNVWLFVSKIAEPEITSIKTWSTKWAKQQFFFPKWKVSERALKVSRKYCYDKCSTIRTCKKSEKSMMQTHFQFLDVRKYIFCSQNYRQNKRSKVLCLNLSTSQIL